MTTQYIKFKNGHLQDLVYLLDGLQLTIKQSRMRTRFKNMLAKYDAEIVVPGKIEILEKFATKNEENKPIIADEETGRYLFEDPEDEKLAREALQELLDETYPIALDEYNKDMLVTVSKAILNSDSDEIKVFGQMADLLAEWCDLFEYIVNYYEKENKG